MSGEHIGDIPENSALAELDRDADLVLLEASTRLLKMEAKLAQRDARITELEQWQRDMVAKAAEKSLDGYRELGQRAAKAEAERDGLAAHVERVKRFWLLIDRGVSNHMERVKLDEIIEASPTTSLARLKAQWQAESLAEMIAAIPFSEELARDMLKHRRDELRRQAEEPAE